MKTVKSFAIVIFTNFIAFFIARYLVENSVNPILDIIFIMSLTNLIIGVYSLFYNEKNANTPGFNAAATALFVKNSPASVDIAIDELRQKDTSVKPSTLLNAYPILIKIFGFLGLGVIGAISTIILYIL
jgi:hypothetical protein